MTPKETGFKLAYEHYEAESCRMQDADRLAGAIAKAIEEATAAANLQNGELKKKLAQIESAVCLNCKGSGEFGLADGEVPCWVCGGSGDPTKPGVFATLSKHDHVWYADPTRGPGSFCRNCTEVWLPGMGEKSESEGNPWAPNQDYPGKPVMGKRKDEGPQCAECLKRGADVRYYCHDCFMT